MASTMGYPLNKILQWLFKASLFKTMMKIIWDMIHLRSSKALHLRKSMDTSKLIVIWCHHCVWWCHLTGMWIIILAAVVLVMYFLQLPKIYWEVPVVIKCLSCHLHPSLQSSMLFRLAKEMLYERHINIIDN